jgi:hypothetical protein
MVRTNQLMTTRQVRQPRRQEHDRQEDQDDQRRRACDRQQIVERGIAPDAAVQVHPQIDDAGDGREAGGRDDDEVEAVVAEAAAHAQIERQNERQRRHDHVMDEGDGRPVQAAQEA